MASNYTTNYKLCQWEATDKVLRTEFNSDNAKIDAAVKAVDKRVDSLSSTVSGKASTTALNSLKTTVDGKADRSALDSLSAVVAQHTDSLEGKGNCQLYAATYLGDGWSGSAHPSSLTFPAVPEIVFIVGNHLRLTLSPVESTSYVLTPSDNLGQVTITKFGKTVSWYGASADAQMNHSKLSYLVVALIKAS